MSLDMNLHRALDKLADTSTSRTDTEERDLVVSARIWLNCYVHDHLWVPLPPSPLPSFLCTYVYDRKRSLHNRGLR